MFGILAGIAAKVIGWVLNRSSNGFIQDVIKSIAGQNNSEAIIITKGLESVVELRKAETEENKAKWSLPWFGIVAGLLLGPVIISMWAVGLYNIFWWSGGMYPQPWAIASWPGIYQEWANMAFTWVFTPTLAAGALKMVIGGRR